MLSAAGDWLQGPYVYALYQHYGFDRGDIGRLFIAGFGSSMIFGTIVGSLADKTCVPLPRPKLRLHQLCCEQVAPTLAASLRQPEAFIGKATLPRKTFDHRLRTCTKDDILHTLLLVQQLPSWPQREQRGRKCRAPAAHGLLIKPYHHNPFRRGKGYATGQRHSCQRHQQNMPVVATLRLLA